MDTRLTPLEKTEKPISIAAEVARLPELSDEDERPLLSVLSYLRPAGGTRCVLLEIGHVLLLSVNSVPAG